MPRKSRQRGRTSSVTAKLRAVVLSLGRQRFVGRIGHLWFASATSERLLMLEVAPALPVSTTETIGFCSPGGGFGFGCGLPAYFAVPPLKTQSQPLWSVTAWWAAPRSAQRLPIVVSVQVVEGS